MGTTQNSEGDHYVVLYPSLSDPEESYRFPCDVNGRVDLDTLSERTRIDYFYARTSIGRVVSRPIVVPTRPAAKVAMPLGHLG